MISGTPTRCSSLSRDRSTASGGPSTRTAAYSILLVQRRRDAKAAKRFFHKVLKGQGEAPRRLFTDKLGSYRVAARELLPGTPHDTSRHANNRVERSHQPTRQQERQMRRFKSRHQAQRFLSLHARVNNLFRYGRHLLGAANHRLFRASASAAWRQITCA